MSNDSFAEYDVAGVLHYEPIRARKEDLQAQALKERPDLRAAQYGMASAQSQLDLAIANSHHDLTTTLNFSHVSGIESLGLFFSFPLPFFDGNQGEIARTKHAITQAEELYAVAKETVSGDVASAYEAVSSHNEIVTLYRSGYLDNARQSRDISEYGYKKGAASLLDFLDAVRSYHTTQLAYRQALASYMLALEQLREAVGARRLP